MVSPIRSTDSSAAFMPSARPRRNLRRTARSTPSSDDRRGVAPRTRRDAARSSMPSTIGSPVTMRRGTRYRRTHGRAGATRGRHAGGRTCGKGRSAGCPSLCAGGPARSVGAVARDGSDGARERLARLATISVAGGDDDRADDADDRTWQRGGCRETWQILSAWPGLSGDPVRPCTCPTPYCCAGNYSAQAHETTVTM